MEISYDKAVKNRISGLKQADGRKIKNNQVLAYDVALEFGDSDDIEAEGINVDEWEKRSLEWLKEILSHIKAVKYTIFNTFNKMRSY